MTAIMGLDISLLKTGLCLPSGQTFTIATGGAALGDRRLTDLRTRFRYYLRRATVDQAVIELATRFQSDTAAIAVGMAQGVIREVLAEHLIPAAFINPTTLKMFAVGHGNAAKAEMVHEAVQLGADERADDNAADAWWLWQMGRWRFGESDLPEIGQQDFDGRGVRHRAVYGPWPKGQGAKWPGVQPARTAVRAGPAGPPVGRKSADRSSSPPAR